MSDLLRVYFDPAEIDSDGYPFAWHFTRSSGGIDEFAPAIKDLIREQAGYRCERCGHPYPPGIAETCPRGEWTPCDELCIHGLPYRALDLHSRTMIELASDFAPEERTQWLTSGGMVEAQWRILTVHHLNGIKHDCRWWNLAALCQRCHLAIQGRVVMERVWPWEHSEWFKPHAAGWYAAAYLGEELSRDETMARLDELLDLERQVQ